MGKKDVSQQEQMVVVVKLSHLFLLFFTSVTVKGDGNTAVTSLDLTVAFMAQFLMYFYHLCVKIKS